MTTCSDPVEALNNPEVKKYFVELLKSSSPPEEKYEALVRFFELAGDLTIRLAPQIAGLQPGDQAAVSRAVASAAQDSGIWQPDLIRRQTEDGLRRALRRIEGSQHRDGGWGYRVEESHLWATAWTVFFLHRAAELGFDANVEAEERGLAWLIDNRGRWSLDSEDVPSAGNSVYEASVAMRTLFATGAAARSSVSRSIERSIERLLDEQRPEGDWDATLWPSPAAAVHEDKREVGATSLTLRALAAAGRSETKMEQAATRALAWLAAQQNPDGSWNASYVPPGTTGPLASVGKTCDALRGFLAGHRLGVDLAPYRQDIERGVRWLVGKEEAVLNEKGQIEGWAWESEAKTSDGNVDLILIENTCLTLETLLDVATLPDIESVSLPQLAASALWLLHNQVRAAGSPDDGKWPNNDTGRIAFAVLRFYSQIKDSPFFQVGPERAAGV